MMNKRRISILLVVALLVTVTLFATACNETEAQFFADIDDNLAAYVEECKSTSSSFLSEETYKYTLTYYAETLANFDEDNREMPTDKLDESQEERKKWYKTNLTYTYVKLGANSYAEATVQEPALDAEGMPTFEDEKFKNPVYLANTTFKIWLDGSNNATVKVDDVTVYAGSFDSVPWTALAAAHRAMKYASENLNLLETYIGGEPATQGLFSIETRNWLSKRIVSSQNYVIEDLSGATCGYRESEFATGFGEDLTFDWANVREVSTDTVCYTSKKGKLVTYEFYNEHIGSYQKTATQIWNGETVTTWYGDRISASKAVFEIEYPAKKVTVEIPAL